MRLLYVLFCIFLIQLVGWGANETDDFSDVLRTAELPVISYNDCVAQANEDFRNIIIPDKFCAGTKSGK